MYDDILMKRIEGYTRSGAYERLIDIMKDPTYSDDTRQFVKGQVPVAVKNFIEMCEQNNDLVGLEKMLTDQRLEGLVDNKMIEDAKNYAVEIAPSAIERYAEEGNYLRLREIIDIKIYPPNVTGLAREYTEKAEMNAYLKYKKEGNVKGLNEMAWDKKISRKVRKLVNEELKKLRKKNKDVIEIKKVTYGVI